MALGSILISSLNAPTNVPITIVDARPWDEGRVKDEIIAAARRLRVPEKLALRIAKRESNFNPHAENWNRGSRTFDRGVMQINEVTAKQWGLQDPFDPESNIELGVSLLAKGYRKYGTEEGAVCYFEHPSKCSHLSKRGQYGR